jgi:ribosome biogenesis GTPase
MSDTPERGVVLRGTGGVWHVMAESGEQREVALRGRLKKGDVEKLAVGDEVVVERDARGGAWAIGEVLPRRSQLTRREPGGGRGERVLAANIDQVMIVFAAAEPEPHARMLDRFLVIAEANDLSSRIVINKVELVGEGAARERFGDYERAGYPMHYTSVKRSLGLEPLGEALGGQVSVLTGPSGVGKSSLLNAIHPGLDLRVGEISRSVMRGRHTTVGAEMHPLPGGGFVLDTPGLREVGVWSLPPDELDRCFLEFRPLLGECRFADCTHRVEPDCAVRDALKDGAISAARYESYTKLYEELDQSWERY